MTILPYRPSNGSEGMDFMGCWCERCAKHRGGRCGILGRTMICSPGDAKYPTEWRYVDGRPTCTAFTEPGPAQPRTTRPCKGQKEMFG
jgi:hypothetical protein